MTARRMWVPALMVALGLAACGPEEPAAAPTVEDTPSVEVERNLLTEALRLRVGEVEGKLLALAEAMPEGTYGWSPADSVRTVGQVFVHVAADNFFIPALMGVSPPGTTGITDDYATLQAYEARAPGKAQIIGELRASFRFFRDALGELEGEVGRTITFGADSTTVAALEVQAITHMHEHLGQAIAYARSNGVTPPWSLPGAGAPADSTGSADPGE